MAITESSISSGSDPATCARVLVIEDSPEFVVVVRTLLEKAGHEVIVATGGLHGIELAATCDPSVIVLDLGLPDIDGLEVCEKLREFTNAYVLMLSGRDAQDDKYEGLAAGADDYLTKPFDPKELLLRIEVLLRRPRVGAQPEPRETYGDLRIDRAARRVWVADCELSLTKIEFAMLSALTENVGVAQTRNDLAVAVWGPHWVGDDHVINVHVANLRKKIDGGPGRRIVTVRGVGYRLEPVEVSDS